MCNERMLMSIELVHMLSRLAAQPNLLLHDNIVTALCHESCS